MTTDFIILLVDDHKANLLVLQRMLEAEGRSFLLATSGHEAIKIAQERDDIGLILLDVQMPDIDGYEVARLLKAAPETSNISIIFVTATNKDEEDMLKGFEKGGVDYLAKPLSKHLTRAKVDVFEKLYHYQRELKQALKAKEMVNGQLERFMHVVAHDLKSPLAGVTGLLLMLKEEEQLKQAPELMGFLDMAIDASGKLSDMISAILEYSREHQDNQPEELVDVKELLVQLVHFLFPPANVHIHIQEELPKLFTSRQKLQQVFQNLVSNAIKYGDKPEIEISIGGTDGEDYYQFYVKDNGPGIAEKDNDRIFHLFEKVDSESTKGTGVGLNILKLLVEAQGGKVWVESVKDEGSTFFFQWRK